MIYIEYFIIASMLFIIILYFINNVDGEWIDTKTGELFIIHNNIARSQDHMYHLTLIVNSVIRLNVKGTYIHPGKIKWNNGTVWIRLNRNTGKSRIARVKNTLIPVMLDGSWYGTSENNSPIFITLSGGLSVKGVLTNNGFTEVINGIFDSHIINFKTELRESITMLWDGLNTASMKINNTSIVMHKLDSII